MAVTEISLNLLRAFDAAARQGSFTEAAKELFVTQAAVSHQIKALEAWLGKPLFHRTSRGLALTDEGLMLAPTVAEALAAIQDAHPEVSIGSYPFFRQGQIGAELVVRSTNAGDIPPVLAAIRGAAEAIGVAWVDGESS